MTTPEMIDAFYSGSPIDTIANEIGVRRAHVEDGLRGYMIGLATALEMARPTVAAGVGADAPSCACAGGSVGPVDHLGACAAHRVCGDAS